MIAKPLLLGLCIIACYATLIQNEEQIPEVSALPLLPLYVGRGYHVLYGNPKSGKKIDPGFLEQAFEFTYLKNYSTPDNRYLVPDQAVSQGLDSCSLTSTVKEFRGAKSYQDNLQTQSKIDSNSQLFDFRFTLSQNYQKVQNSTTAFQEVVHSEAVCQYNHIILNRNQLPKLSSNFIKSAIHSQQVSNWAGFLATYGTHYAHDVIMGARAVQETVYTYKGASILGAIPVDIPLVAKASFAKFFNDSSFDYRKYQSAIQYSESYSSRKSQFYQGSAPTRDGNATQWYESVQNDSAPIAYKLASISELVALIKDPAFDTAAALNQLNTWIRNECVKSSCKIPNNDFPPVPAAKSQVDKTAVMGNATSGATFFQDSDNTTVTKEVREVYACFSSTYFYALKFLISDGITQRWTGFGGKCNHTTDSWKVPQGEHITKVWMKYTSYVRCVGFITNKGTGSNCFGDNTGTWKEVVIPTDYRMVGFQSTFAAVHFYTLGLFISKIDYPPTPANSTVQLLKLQIE